MSGDGLYFAIKRGDRKPALRVRLKNPDGSPLDLTNSPAIKFYMGVDGQALKVNSNAAIVSASTGTVEYQWGSTDTDTVGVYRAEFEVQGSTDTYPKDGYITVDVQSDLG